jgi:SNF2 family DNA or RNA helicase
LKIGSGISVAYHFKSDLARIQAAFPQARVLDSDPQTIKDWNAGRIPVLLAHPQSAGHGLSLQDGGNILVFFSHWWSLEEHQQIIERVGPMRQLQSGHNRPVFIHHIVARDTVDLLVMQRRATKQNLQSLLLEALRNRQELRGAA